MTRLDEGAGIEVPVDPAALRALFALDGSLPVGDLPDAERGAPDDPAAPSRPGSPGALQWAILDSNQGPPPYQSGALTN